MLAKLCQDLLVHLGAAVEHSHHKAFDGQRRIQAVLDDADGLEQLAEAFQGEKLGLNGNYHGIGCRQGVDCDQSQRGRTVDYDVVVGIADGGDGVLQHGLAVLLAYHFYVDTHKVDVRRYHMQSGHLSLDKRVFHGNRALHKLVQAAVPVIVGREIETGSRVGLGIGVDDQHFLFQSSERGGEVDGCSGLSHASFLVCYSYYFSHNMQKYEIILTFQYPPF